MYEEKSRERHCHQRTTAARSQQT